MEIGGHSNAGGFEFGQNSFSIVGDLVADRKDTDLLWREPGWEVAAKVFDQESDETFVGAERSTVDAQWRFFGVLARGVFQPESRWNGEIDLVGGDCEFATDGTPNLDVDLRSVEGCFVGNFDVVDTRFLENVAHHIFSLYPELLIVDELLAQLLRVMSREAH